MTPRNHNTHSRPSASHGASPRSTRPSARSHGRPATSARSYSRDQWSATSARNRQAARHGGFSLPSMPSMPSNPFASASDTGEKVLDKGVFTIPNSELVVTRRHFLYGALGIGAIAAASTAVAASGILAHDDADFPLLTVPTSAVIASDALTEVDIDGSLALIGRFELPYGTLVWCNDDSVACCLTPGEAAKPLTQVQLLFLGSGNTSIIVEQAVGQKEGYEIYDARATSEGVIWTEADILEGAWRVYTAKFNSAGVPQEPVLVDKGDSAWEAPSLAMVGGYAFWQVMPRANGAASSSKSALKKAKVGSSNVEVPYLSSGRMATPPSATRRGVCITPRTDTATVHYQLTYLDADSNEVLDYIALPQNMKPLDVGYGKTGFMFCFEGIYDYGDGIANLGSYIPRASATGEGYSNVSWFRWSRTPLCAPCWCNDYLMVKSTQSVCGIDLSDMTYCATEVQTGSDDYGDYLATTGESSHVVTFSNVISKGINQDEERYCLVRVYVPA